MPAPPDRPPECTDARVVSRDFLNVLGVHVVAGRGLDDRDREGQSRVMLINETLARSAEFTGNPIGQRFYTIGEEPWEIVGIVEDVHQFGPDRAGAADLHRLSPVAGVRSQWAVHSRPLGWNARRARVERAQHRPQPRSARDSRRRCDDGPAVRLSSTLRRRRADADLDREIASHISLLEAEYRRRGLNDDAGIAARRAMGSIALTKRLASRRAIVWVARRCGVICDSRRGCSSAARASRLWSLYDGSQHRRDDHALQPRLWRAFAPAPMAGARSPRTPSGDARRQVSRVPWTMSNAAYLAWREQPRPSKTSADG